MVVETRELDGWSPEVVSASARRRSRPRSGLAPFPSLRAKLILYYVFLMLAIAMLAVFVITRLVAASAYERFDNQLREASRTGADSVARLERNHLESLRQIAQTDGVWQALASGDAGALEGLLAPLALEAGAQVVAAVDSAGRDVLTLYRQPGAPELSASSGADYSSLSVLQNVLSGQVDQTGDKFSGLATFPSGAYVLSSAPVRGPDGQLSGALLLGTRLDEFATALKAHTLADVFILGADGRLLATTLAEPDQGFGVFELLPAQVPAAGAAFSRDLELYGRDFRALYSPLVLRGEPQGSLGVVLPADYVANAVTTSRNTLLVVFVAGTLFLMVVGYSLAQGIAGPIMRLQSVAAAAMRGDLNQSTELGGSDEIGQLAYALDNMIDDLRHRKLEVRRLAAEVSQRNRALADARAQLQAARQQLLLSDRYAAIGALTAGLADQVKDPLSLIIGTADELSDAPRSEADLHHNVRVIRDNAVKAERLLSDLLKVAREMPLDLQWRDLRQTIDAAVESAARLARESGVEVQVQVPDEVLLVEHDADQIEQVLVNLIRNGVRAMPEGGSLTIHLRDLGTAAAVAVQDTGAGIPREELPHLFDPFSGSARRDGRGLGLAVSYMIVAAHHGRLDVASRVGQGSVFSLWLPQEQPPAAKETTGAAQEGASA